jgi:hypothetical protein
MFSLIARMDSVTFWGGMPAAAVKTNEAIESPETRVAYREALGRLKAAQGYLSSNTNPVMKGEIEAAIREIRSTGTLEFSEYMQEPGAEGRLGAAISCLAKAERALEQVKATAKGKQALMHVRTAKWWVVSANRSTPRYTQVLAVR